MIYVRSDEFSRAVLAWKQAEILLLVSGHENSSLNSIMKHVIPIIPDKIFL
jgi:hypothetical protein